MNKLEITTDKQWLAAAGNPHIKLYEVSSHNPQPTQTYDVHTSNVTAVGFHKEGKWMFSGSEDGTIKVFDIRAPGAQQEYISRGPVTSVELHPNQEELISGLCSLSLHEELDLIASVRWRIYTWRFYAFIHDKIDFMTSVRCTFMPCIFYLYLVNDVLCFLFIMIYLCLGRNIAVIGVCCGDSTLHNTALVDYGNSNADTSLIYTNGSNIWHILKLYIVKSERHISSYASHCGLESFAKIRKSRSYIHVTIKCLHMF